MYNFGNIKETEALRDYVIYSKSHRKYKGDFYPNLSSSKTPVPSILNRDSTVMTRG